MLAHEQYRKNNRLQLVLFLIFPKGSRDLAINYGKCIDAAQMLVFAAQFSFFPLLFSLTILKQQKDVRD